MAKSVGGALTGQDDETDGGLKDIVSSASQKVESFLPQDPNSRSALLQIGLGLMQPMSMGQTTGGHIAQAIGSGGEAVGRIEKEDLDQKKADDKLDIADRNMLIRQQMADAATARAHRTLGEMTQYQREKLQFDQKRDERADAKEARKETVDDQKSSRQQAQDAQREARQQARDDARQAREDEKELNKDVDAAETNRDSLVLPDDSPLKKRWEGKSRQQIREELRSERTPAAAVAPPPTPQSGGVAKAPTVTQNGVKYYLQPDGSYK